MNREIKFSAFDMKGIIKNILFSITGISVIILLIAGCGYIQQQSESKETISYAGFEEIDALKNYFLIIGDSRSASSWEFWWRKNDQERRLIVEEMARLNPAFIIHLGDLVTKGSSRNEWQAFNSLNIILREKKIPYFPILGNHEVSGNVEEALQNYFQSFPALDHRRWYSFIWKNVGFIMVDSNFSTMTPEENERQVQWYLNELENFEKDNRLDYIIVCCHEPPFTNSRVGPNQKSKTYFADPFLRFRKTSFFFSGHAHTYERFQIESKFFIVSGGGGAPLHKITIDPTKRRYDDLFKGPDLRFFHICQIETRDKILFYRVIRLEFDGTFTIVDPLTIQH